MKTKYISPACTIVALIAISMLTCKPGPNNPASAMQAQNKTVFEVPEGLNADVYRIMIVPAEGDSTVYFEVANGNKIIISIPSGVDSHVFIDAFDKEGIRIFAGEALLPIGQTEPVKVTARVYQIPAAPGAFEVNLVADKYPRLSWAVSAGAESFAVFRSQSESETPGKILATTNLSFIDSTVSLGAVYYYMVTASNPGGESEPTAIQSIMVPNTALSAPAMPTELKAVATSSTEIVLTFSASNGALGYVVSGGVDASVLEILDTTMYPTYTHGGLKAGTTYYYAVTAFNDQGMSPRSAVASTESAAIPKPSTPQGLAAQPISASANMLRFNAVVGATSYIIYSGSTASVQNPLDTISDTTFTHSGLIALTTYYYVVAAANASGVSARSATVSAMPLQIIPTTPSGVTAMATGATSVAVAFSAVSNATSYAIYRTTQGATQAQKAGSVTVPAFNDTGLTPQTAYGYSVSALVGTSASPMSAVVWVTTGTLNPATPPAAPVLTAAAKSDSSIQITWQAVYDATSYIIERATATAGPFAVVCTTAATEALNVKLNANTPYYFRGKAVNSAGVSPNSATVTATTSIKLVAPVNLVKGTVTATSIALSWQAVTGAQSYKIHRSQSTPGAFSQVGTATTTQFTDTGLTSNTAYGYKVSAASGQVESPQSTALTVTTIQAGLPTTPTGLSATAASSTQMTIKFTAVTGATGYKLYWSINNTSFTAITITTTTYTHSNLTVNTSYYYKISAIVGGVESAQSAVVTAKTKTRIAVIGSNCNGCDRCVSACDVGAIKRSGNVFVIDPALCKGDGDCVSRCPRKAITLK
jgi:fibronectin type 3 domain-containing protein